MKIKHVVVFMILLPVEAGAAWTKAQNQLYVARDFVSLQQSLVSAGRNFEASEIARQNDDLEGCREVKHGAGGARSVIKCMWFLDRERKLGLTSPGRGGLETDLNTLCVKLARDTHSLRRFLDAGIYRTATGAKIWRTCAQSLWEQVYLTAYARIDADPVGSLALVREAEAHLPPAGRFRAKINELFARP